VKTTFQLSMIVYISTIHVACCV